MPPPQSAIRTSVAFRRSSTSCFRLRASFANERLPSGGLESRGTSAGSKSQVAEVDSAGSSGFFVKFANGSGSLEPASFPAAAGGSAVGPAEDEMSANETSSYTGV